MTERIDSPEKFNRLMKISTPGIWIIMIVMLVAVAGGLILFLSHDIVIRQSHLCYVSDVCKPSKEAMYELASGHGEGVVKVWREAVDATNVSETLPPYVQSAYLIVKDMDSAQLSAGMTLEFDGIRGKIVEIENAPVNHEELLQLGMDSREMRLAGLSSAASYYLCRVFLFNDGPTPTTASGFYTADVTLEVIKPLSLILK